MEIIRATQKSIVSYLDQFPEFEGVVVEIRGTDGYFDATSMRNAMKAFDGKTRRFNDWTRTNFAKRLLQRLSDRSEMPVSYGESLGTQILAPNQKPLIDYVRGRGSRVWLHPYVAMSYAMSVPEFQAEVNIWIVDLMVLGTVNPHIMQWTKDQYLQGLQYNRDDITDTYG